MTYKEIDGDLIELALAGSFDVIAHGCNCFCMQGAGIAKQMSKTFNTLDFALELPILKGNMLKLGDIDFEEVLKTKDGNIMLEKLYDVPQPSMDWNFPPLTVVNAYTQYEPGANLDYEALTLCLRKINHKFKNKHIGLPGFIGGGIAGGDNDIIRNIIKKELADCDVTIVFLPQNNHFMLDIFK